MADADHASQRIARLQRASITDDSHEAPFQNMGSVWAAMARPAVVIMCVLAIGAALYLTRSILLPVLSAIIVGMTFGPYVGKAARHGVPPWVMATGIVILVVGIANLAVVALANPVSEMLRRTPEIAEAIKEKLQFFNQPLIAFYQLQAAFGSVEGIELNPGRIVAGFVTVVTPAAFQFAAQLVLFAGTLFFFILARTSFRSHTVQWFSSREARLRALKVLNKIEQNLSDYLVVVTFINLGLGVATAAVAYLLQLPYPLMWGVLAFGLNYIPYIGAAFVILALFLVGLLTYPTLPSALVPPVVFLALTTIEGQFLTPAIVGRRVLQVNPLIVFLAIAFWAWMWGPVGAFLAVPLLIVFRSVIVHLQARQGGELPD
jgi:predicted PurR-regulated permease PerM